MILNSDQYEIYQIPIPTETQRNDLMTYVLRQIEKRHPCINEGYVCDILVTGIGKKRMATVTVVHESVLLLLYESRGNIASLVVRNGNGKRYGILPSGPVTQLRRRILSPESWCRWVLPVAAVMGVVAVGAYVIMGAGKGKGNLVSGEQKMEQPVETEAGYVNGAENMAYGDWWNEVEERDCRLEDETQDIVDTDRDGGTVVPEQAAEVWKLPDDAWLVGTVFDHEGSKTVFYRSGDGKLKSVKVPMV